nr:Rieske 2Fe-2S domain-containing protein [Streptomyces sp. SID5468]
MRETADGRQVEVTVAGCRFLIDAACPHRKGRLVHGYVNARSLRITCPLHHSSFELATGRPVTGPATEPLAVGRCDDAPDGAPAPATPEGEAR